MAGSVSKWETGCGVAQPPSDRTPRTPEYNPGIRAPPSHAQTTPGPRLAPAPTSTQTLTKRGRPVGDPFCWKIDQALRRRRVYQTEAPPPATIRAPTAMIVLIGAPVTGSACPALTPPLGVAVAPLTPVFGVGLDVV